MSGVRPLAPPRRGSGVGGYVPNATATAAILGTADVSDVFGGVGRRGSGRGRVEPPRRPSFNQHEYQHHVGSGRRGHTNGGGVGGDRGDANNGTHGHHHLPEDMDSVILPTPPELASDPGGSGGARGAPDGTGRARPQYITGTADDLEIDLRPIHELERREEIVIRRATTAEPLGMTVEGTVVTGVTRDGAADRAGLRVGDKLLKAGGRPVANYPEVAEQLGAARGQPTVTLEVLPGAGTRGGSRGDSAAASDAFDDRGGGGGGGGSKPAHLNLNDVLAPIDYNAPLPDKWAEDALEPQPGSRVMPQTDTSFAFWKSAGAVQVRAGLIMITGLMSFLFYILGDEKGTCETDLDTFLLVNCIILIPVGLLMFFIALMGGANGKDQGPAYTASVTCLTSFVGIWIIIWLLVQVNRLAYATSDACGSMYTLSMVMAIVLMLVVGLLFLCFCAAVTHTGDEEFHSLAYTRGAI